MSTSTGNRTKKSVYGTSRAGVSKTSKKSVPNVSDSRGRVGRSIYGGASRTGLSSSSKKNVQLGGVEKLGATYRPPVQVFDDEGRDVTPLPLSQQDPNTVRGKQSNLLADGSGSTPTDLMSQASIYQAGTAATASTFGGGPFTRSVFSASQSGRSTGSINDDLNEPTAEITSGWTDIKTRREEVKEDLTEEDLEKNVNVELTETETIWLLDIHGVCVSSESNDSVTVQEQNAKYQELVKSRAGNDRYSERGMNTFNEAPKYKAVQTNRVNHNEVGITATTWDMYDTYEALAAIERAKEEALLEAAEDGSIPSGDAAGEKTDAEKPEGDTVEDGKVSASQGLDVAQDRSETSKKGTIISFMGESSATMSSMFGGDSIVAVGVKERAATGDSDEQSQKDKEILMSEELKQHLVIMERAVNLNTYQPRQACYRGLGIVDDIDKVKQTEDGGKPTSAIAAADLGPNLDRLWAYQCPLTKGRNVSCITWNKVNPDLLAVGYGQFEFTNQRGGMVCCWSLKNPEYPERVFTSEAGVTAMDFSLAHPNLLAVGMYNGTVAIYNVRSSKDETVLDSFESSGKHTGPVWQLKWIEKERGSGEERAEVLVSVSTDGRVTQWSIRKGFESYDLMKLKRVTAKQGAGKTKKSEAFISRYAGGMCFDFSTKDSNIYLVGTEEGHIHRCSCSYNEQYLDSYNGHTGPVYSIEWSPFLSDVFLSCSGDWTVRLWHQDKLHPVLNFHSSTKAVPGVSWSPKSSTVFSCVNEGGVEVWDLSQSTLDPIIQNTPSAGVKLSAVTFAKNSECILVGDSEGSVTVYQLRSMPAREEDPSNPAAELVKIVQQSLASQLSAKQ